VKVSSFGLEILAIAAHPDDVELTCGGVLARAAADGHATGVLDLTAGEMGTRGTAEIRAAEARAAGTVLGLRTRECLSLPDGRVENTAEARVRVAEAIRRHRPRILIAPFPTDLHPDHAHTGEIVRDAFFLSRLGKLGQSGAHKPQALLYTMHHTPFEPTFVADVTRAFETKMAACRAYASQLHDPESREPATQISDPEFLEAIVARARFYGSLIGVRFGEPFRTLEPLPMGDVVRHFSGGGGAPR
jgi:bacillithiol biosynthesis deacetylase BshB1